MNIIFSTPAVKKRKGSITLPVQPTPRPSFKEPVTTAPKLKVAAKKKEPETFSTVFLSTLQKTQVYVESATKARLEREINKGIF